MKEAHREGPALLVAPSYQPGCSKPGHVASLGHYLLLEAVLPKMLTKYLKETYKMSICNIQVLLTKKKKKDYCIKYFLIGRHQVMTAITNAFTGWDWLAAACKYSEKKDFPSATLLSNLPMPELHTFQWAQLWWMKTKVSLKSGHFLQCTVKNPLFEVLVALDNLWFLHF